MQKTDKEKMLAGELYLATDAELSADRMKSRKLVKQLNDSAPDELALRTRIYAELLRWREKVNRAAKSVGCAEMQNSHKLGGFTHFGETDESPDTFKFYFQHNIPYALMIL